MPIFIYKAKSRSGRSVKGDLDAPTLEFAENILRRKGCTDVRVKPKPKDLLEGTFLEGGVSDRDMVVFSRQFATMINAGVPILQALQIMCEQTENAKLRRKQELGKPVVIGSDVWVGGGAIICPEVTIGSRCIIGAGSVVTQDIPEGVFAAGNPLSF
jgi:hypothetical protein